LTTNLFTNEIGDGMGASYPTQYDTNNYPESAGSYWTYRKGNDVKECITAIEGTLGIRPAGSFNTVRQRLDYLDPITSSNTIVFLSVFQSSMSEIVRVNNAQENKINAVTLSTGNIYGYDNVSQNITKKSDAYIIYGSTTASYTFNPDIILNGVNEIKSIMLTDVYNSTGGSFLYYVGTSSFSIKTQNGSQYIINWQAIVR